MIAKLLFEGVAAVAVVAVVLAFYKHKTLAAVESSAKKELAYLEGLASKVEASAKADFAAVVARLKAIF